MSRDIKFRAWLKFTNPVMIYSKELGDFFDHKIRGYDYELMQFTGLTDKNGKDVYEDDMFRRNGHLGIVRFRKGRFVIEFDDGKIFDLHVEPDWDWWLLKEEVIGNMHENDNLIK
jgi:uncharacterized phage protein (TIGR01671 family)